MAGRQRLRVGRRAGIVADSALPPLYDPYYEPYWAACADLGLILSVHAGWGQPQGMVYAFFDLMAKSLGNIGEMDQRQIQTMLRQQLDSSDESPFGSRSGPAKSRGS